MNYLEPTLFLVVPLLASAFFVLVPNPSERLLRVVAGVAAWVTSVACLGTLLAVGMGWIPREFQVLEIFATDHYQFPIVLYFDLNATVFLIMTSILALLVVSYSRVYLHREAGYRRYFSCIFLFWTGLNLLFSAGTLDLLFAGWEMVGVSSFLLIAFYWERHAPAQNAFRAYCVYRFCDLGLLLGAWLNHVLWHQADHFSGLTDSSTGLALAALGPSTLALFGGLVILAASGKSAQGPFLFWLPKAMEGPTPSSAIFYGALSVHAGVFLLLRMYPVWSASTPCVIAVAAIGLWTVTIASIAGRSQSNIKAQIAYASATQVGLQFVELALGLQSLVLAHFVANAGFRCYQLLVSPSVVAYLLRLQGSVSSQLRVKTGGPRLPPRIRASLYVFSLCEGYLESIVMFFVLTPFAFVQKFLHARSVQVSIALSMLLALSSTLLIGVRQHGALSLDAVSLDAVSWVVCAASVFAALLAVTERKSLRAAWALSGASSLFAAIAVGFQQPDAWSDLHLYIFGVLVFWSIGIAAILKLETGAPKRDFNRGAGRVLPTAGLILILAFLGVSGFPLSPTFIGEDLLLHHATVGHAWMSGIVSLAFVLNGIAMVRAMVPLHLAESEV